MSRDVLAKVVTATLLGAWLASRPGPAVAAPGPTVAEVERGRYLARAGDCAGCHDGPEEGGRSSSGAFAGGSPIGSPFGPIFATNITPSRAYGIGDYRLADFDRALRQGIRRDGAYLYPAMPYTAYARLTDADVRALYAYFMRGVVPIDRPVRATHLPFPFGVRRAVGLWNRLYLSTTPWRPDPLRTSSWNRGAYLVEVLGHCSSCHSPRTLFMGESRRARFGGGRVDRWIAPNISGDPSSGIGAWRRSQLSSYLKTGRAAGRAIAAGPMATVVEHSLQFLRDADIEAMVDYLQSIPPVQAPNARPGPAPLAASAFEARGRGLGWASGDGAHLYSGLCASCHGPDGRGTQDGAFPALVGNSTVAHPAADNLIAVITEGVARDAAGHRAFMPRFVGPNSFVQRLNSEQIAALATHVRSRFGRGGEVVTAAQVSRQMRGGAIGPVAVIQAVVGVIVLAVAVSVTLILRWRRTRVAP
jgi:mono/diheme cytochrome c family protein